MVVPIDIGSGTVVPPMDATLDPVLRFTLTGFTFQLGAFSNQGSGGDSKRWRPLVEFDRILWRSARVPGYRLEGVLSPRSEASASRFGGMTT